MCIQKLSDFTKIIMGQSPKGSSYNENRQGYPLLNGAADYKGQIFKPKKYTNQPTRLVEEGDILLGIRATIGNFAFADRKYCIGRGVAGIRVNDELADKNYIKRIVENELNKILHTASGSTIKGIKKEDLTDMLIKLPPLDTQKKIATILDEADKLRQLDKKLIEKYDALTQSLFLDMFGDTWTNPKNWEIKLIEELASTEKHSIKAGPFGSSLKKEYYVESGYKIYGQEQVIKDDLSFGNYYIDQNKFQSLKNCRIKAGDILISLVGTYGKISVVPEIFEEGIINPRLMKISPNQEIIRPDFLKMLLRSSGVLLQMENKSRGGTMDIVNVGIMRKIKVPLPPIKLQNQFAERVQSIESQKAQAQQSLQKSEELFNSLLQKAFKGELA
ncbi:restriction endonuclease subunit S [Yeosuana marina]|uniref:restriction endonuclease subunit S n=1 Tax=Yeosuana marina TaxID=1565536 RepID=UPI0030C89E57